MPKPRIVILAGPNGAGKTTASKFLLRDALGIGEFVNADTIATGLSGFAPESVAFEAGRIMLGRIHALLDEGGSFAFETTLASRTLAKLISRALERGYEVELIYLALPSPLVAQERVAARVKAGGHDVPTTVIERRFRRSLVNLFQLYIPIVTRWRVFDNYAALPSLVASGGRGRRKIVSDQKWKELVELSRKL